MSGVERHTGGSIEILLKRFRRELALSGHMQEYRRHQRFLSRGELRRDKMRKALRRLRRKEDRRRGRRQRED